MSGAGPAQGPYRRIVKRLGCERVAAVTRDGRPYTRPRYRFELACGHVVERSTEPQINSPCEHCASCG